ncbi:MAG: oligoendopeptidase F, partial [Phototrophicales bacterium]
LFFSLELMQTPFEILQAWLQDESLAPYHHYLEITQLSAPYALSEPEEYVINKLSLTSSNGWSRYFGEVMSNARYHLNDQQLNQSEILQYLYSPDRELRRQAADAFTEGLEAMTHTTTYIFNMMLLNKEAQDELRHLPSWIRSRNISNQVDDETVNILINSVTSRYDIVARYYRLFKAISGYEELFDYDRYAPITQSEQKIHWDEAVSMVLSAFERFSPKMSEVAQQFFEKKWIDARVAPHKRGGAFSHSVVASAHPYILMNYVGDLRSVQTLAHELGHGIHQYLSRQVGTLQQSTPLTTAEMASTFAEMLVFDALIETITDPQERLALRLDKITDTFATVFRQISMNRFEDAIHTTVRQQGELSTEQFCELWMQTQIPMFGDSLTLRDEYRLWWSYIPHFISTPGYVYAYAFGELLVWALYAKYQEVGSDFAKHYIEALSKGGSVWPHELVAPLGIDLNDENFWLQGLQLVEDMIALAESEAAALGKITA